MPAETGDGLTGADVGDGGGLAEGDEVGAEEVEQRPPPRAFIKSRRQRQEEEEAAAGQDRFKLINGKEVAALCSFICLAFCGLDGLIDRLSEFLHSTDCCVCKI